MQTLEKILKTFIHEKPRDWDEIIPYIHMALCETPQCHKIFTISFAYGDQMRGLLRVARESYENGDVMEKYRKSQLLNMSHSCRTKLRMSIKWQETIHKLLGLK